MTDVAEAMERGGLDRWRVVPLTAPLYLVDGVGRLSSGDRYDKTPEQVEDLVEQHCREFAGTAQRVYALCVDVLGETDPTPVTANYTYPSESRGYAVGETAEQAEQRAVAVFRRTNA